MVENVRNQHHSLRHRPNPVSFSAAVGPATLGLSRRYFGEDLWTLPTADDRVRFSDWPLFSGALYFADLVQSLKSHT
jgi:hypothetical protein